MKSRDSPVFVPHLKFCQHHSLVSNDILLIYQLVIVLCSMMDNSEESDFSDSETEEIEGKYIDILMNIFAAITDFILCRS